MHTVLIADKSPANRELLRDILQKNYNVITLEDARGLEQLEAIPDIVLAGRETAREVMKTIERIAPYKKIPLLLLLDTFTLPDEQMLKEYNARKYLIIPGTGEKILQEIEDALKPAFEEELRTTEEQGCTPTITGDIITAPPDENVLLEQEEKAQTTVDQESLLSTAGDIITAPPNENEVLDQEIVIGEASSEVLEEDNVEGEEGGIYWGSVLEDSFKKDIVPKYLEATERIMEEMALYLKKNLEGQIRKDLPLITQKIITQEIENLKRLFHL